MATVFGMNKKNCSSIVWKKIK